MVHASYPGSIAASLVYANALLVNGDFGRARAIYAGALELIPDARKQLKESLSQTLAALSGGKVTRAPASSAKPLVAPHSRKL